jgi:integrase/recombinase XerD
MRTFCHTLAYTVCRISEALQVTSERVDFEAGGIVFESLKRRRKGIYRAAPVPPRLLDLLELVHGLRDKRPLGGRDRKSPPPLWEFGRTTAWKKVRTVMAAAGVIGAQENGCC